ncbi:uncharacterized protein OCT59_011356 [Rhizophagus irregularis]|uniref:uncharacterized protein n=1 Tax=Rhizophagus irregularis TaxID=588596 RepID=UPI003319CF40|nr:hypothetical protein OCT59_011356 [Rhizophagus irregularis]
MRGTIIEQKCNVKFIKFIPYDLVACLYIALVCIGNTIKATFDKDALAEIVHASSNNIDKLQSLVAKIYIAFNTKNLIYIIMCVVLSRRLDERIFKIAETHDRYGIPYTRRDKSEIKNKQEL